MLMPKKALQLTNKISREEGNLDVPSRKKMKKLQGKRPNLKSRGKSMRKMSFALRENKKRLNRFASSKKPNKRGNRTKSTLKLPG